MCSLQKEEGYPNSAAPANPAGDYGAPAGPPAGPPASQYGAPSF